LPPAKHYFIASTTKLYITALFLRLKYQQGFDLNSPIHLYLDDGIMRGLHSYRGKEYSKLITVKHLLSHTSGLPDYFQQKNENGKSLLERLIQNENIGWSFEDAISSSKKLQPHFYPGEKSKAFYSDTNYQLLGKILENHCQCSLSALLQKEIYDVIGLKDTWMFDDRELGHVAPIYYKSTALQIPAAMSSFWADGGLVSTSSDSMKFIRSFFNGDLFPNSYLPELYHWNRIFFPLRYGMGIALFKLPRIFSPFSAMPEFIGHSGLSGAFAFYSPSRDLYLTGTVNQIHNPGTSFRMMLKVAAALKEK
jgi:CubicO group peptidase (beta-lactamase class C family)